jgi:hypothetical protein
VISLLSGVTTVLNKNDFILQGSEELRTERGKKQEPGR